MSLRTVDTARTAAFFPEVRAQGSFVEEVSVSQVVRTKTILVPDVILRRQGGGVLFLASFSETDLTFSKMMMVVGGLRRGCRVGSWRGAGGEVSALLESHVLAEHYVHEGIK